MKKKLFGLGMAAILLSVGLVLTGCGNGSGSGSGGGSLVGRWAMEGIPMGGIAYYEFTSDGWLLHMGMQTLRFATDGNTITTYDGPLGWGGTANFSISGNTLTISNPTPHSGLLAGRFTRMQ